MVNQRDSYGRTPLHDACTSGRPESVHLLLKAGADITILDNNKRTPLHACAEFAEEEKIWALLSRPNQIAGHLLQDRFRPVSKRSPSYQPWYTVERRWQDPTFKEQDSPSISLIVKTLLSAGSDVMAADKYHRTPLDLAIEYDCQEMIPALQFSAVLLRKKWDVKPKDRRLSTVLALKKTKISSLSTMDPEDPSRQEILENVSTYLPSLTLNDIEWISQHSGNITGADASKPLSSGRSLLHIAASKGFTWLVKGFGPLARVNDESKSVLQRIHEQLSTDPKYNPGIENLSPTLHVACARQLPNMDMVEVLVETCGVDVNARAVAEPQKWARINDAVEGGTALHVLANANYWWQLEALKYLLQKGANIDAINETGESPLHIACTNTTYAAINCHNDGYGYWRIECVKMLLESGANINILDNTGLSCLHKASSSPQIMRILLKHGADINAGKISPLFSAIQIQCLETLTILLDAGVSPNIVDPNTGHDGFHLHYKAKDASRSALFCAAFANLHNQRHMHSAPMVKLLIKRGADIYAPLNDKETLVHYVFENAEFEIVSAFLDCADKIDFNTRDSLGRTVFLAACEWIECLPGYRHKHWDPKATAPFIRTLEFGANPLDLDNEGQNALHLLLNNPEMEEEAIIQFLAHDANKTLLYQKDINSFTPLNCALRLLRPAVVEVLIGMGVDFLSSDPTGATALHHIAAQCLCVRPQLRRNVYSSEHKPEYYTNALVLWKKFLLLGGSVNVRDNKGAPPLFYYLSSAERDDYNVPEHCCCHFENFATYFSEEVVKDLDFQAKNGNGENALHVIARREKRGRRIRVKEQEHDHDHEKDLYQFFVRKGLNPLEEDGKGRSSLDVAAACEQKGILELFQYGKSPEFLVL
jgi:ankyrin repeat protein